MTYDEELDVFLYPKPYPSWVLSDATYLWEPPIATPTTDGQYSWDESTLSWVVVE
jgi:hypothetical protein